MLIWIGIAVAVLVVVGIAASKVASKVKRLLTKDEVSTYQFDYSFKFCGDQYHRGV